MKQIILSFIIFLWCGLANAQSPKKVVATASMLADMAEVISGGLVEVDMIVPIGGDPHIYEPKPSDVSKVVAADLILKNGLTFEGWLNELIENSGTKARIVTVTDGIQPIESEIYHNATDPHAWMDASLGLTYAQNIGNALMQLDPDNADKYEFNLGIYKQQIQDLDNYIMNEIKTIQPDKRVLITSHDAFHYYGRRYGLELESVVGTSTDAEAQTADIMRLTKVIQERNLPAIFVESTINPKMLNQIAKDTGVKIGGKLFADSVGGSETNASTYIKMLKHNTDVIVNALKAEGSQIHQEHEKNSKDNWIYYALLGLTLIASTVYVYNNIQT